MGPWIDCRRLQKRREKTGFVHSQMPQFLMDWGKKMSSAPCQLFDRWITWRGNCRRKQEKAKSWDAKIVCSYISICMQHFLVNNINYRYKSMILIYLGPWYSRKHYCTRMFYVFSYPLRFSLNLFKENALKGNRS